MLYFSFLCSYRRGEIPSREEKRRNLWERIKMFLMEHIDADPDFYDKLSYVAKWYLEYDDEYDESMREIGLDCHNNIIIEMPDEHNYGFWLDTNCTIDDFRKMSGFKMITEQEFNDLWNSVKYDRKAGVFIPNCNAR